LGRLRKKSKDRKASSASSTNNGAISTQRERNRTTSDEVIKKPAAQVKRTDKERGLSKTIAPATGWLKIERGAGKTWLAEVYIV